MNTDLDKATAAFERAKKEFTAAHSAYCVAKEKWPTAWIDTGLGNHVPAEWTKAKKDYENALRNQVRALYEYEKARGDYISIELSCISSVFHRRNSDSE